MDFLLKFGAQRNPGLLTNNGHHRGAIPFGIVEPIEQVDCPGPGCSHAYPTTLGKFCVGGSHKGGYLSVTGTNIGEVFSSALGTAHRPVKTANTIPVVAIPMVQTPLN